MLRCCPPFKVVAITFLLGSALCVFLDYLSNGRADQPTRKRTNSRESLALVLSPGLTRHSTGSPVEETRTELTNVLSHQDEIKGLLAIKKENGSSSCLPTPSNITSQSVEEVEKFVFFIGYPRSGHSIVASMIDAHPNAILAHELNLFSKISRGQDFLLNSKYDLFNALYWDSYTEATKGWRSGSREYDKKGYSLKLNTCESWQGRFSSLKVIGDKAGGRTARVFRDKPKSFQEIYRSLADTVGVPIRVIHVIRNPFDMIATRLLYRLSSERRQKAEFNSTNKLKDETVIRQASEGLFGEANAVHQMIKACNLTVLEIHNVDFIRDTRKQMTSVCRFLGLNCSESFLQMCANMTYKHVSRTRDALEWSETMLNLVSTRIILGFPFFHRYSFETD